MTAWVAHFPKPRESFNRTKSVHFQQKFNTIFLTHGARPTFSILKWWGVQHKFLSVWVEFSHRFHGFRISAMSKFSEGKATSNLWKGVRILRKNFTKKQKSTTGWDYILFKLWIAIHKVQYKLTFLKICKIYQHFSSNSNLHFLRYLFNSNCKEKNKTKSQRNQVFTSAFGYFYNALSFQFPHFFSFKIAGLSFHFRLSNSGQKWLNCVLV